MSLPHLNHPQPSLIPTEWMHLKQSQSYERIVDVPSALMERFFLMCCPHNFTVSQTTSTMRKVLIFQKLGFVICLQHMQRSTLRTPTTCTWNSNVQSLPISSRWYAQGGNWATQSNRSTTRYKSTWLASPCIAQLCLRIPTTSAHVCRT